MAIPRLERFTAAGIVSLAMGVTWAMFTSHWLAVSGHPNRIFLSRFWGCGAGLGALLYLKKIRPKYSSSERKSDKQVLHWILHCIVFTLAGWCYGVSLTPPHPDPGQTLDGLFFGAVGALTGGILGARWSRPEESGAPEIGFES